MQDVSLKQKQEVFHKLKTGKNFRRSNLFYTLFKLTGNLQNYDGVVYTDGFSKKGRRRAVVRLASTDNYNIDFAKTLEKQFSEYIDNPQIFLNRLSKRININYSNVNWNKIDLIIEKETNTTL